MRASSDKFNHLFVICCYLIEIFGSISYSARAEINQKEKIEIIPTPNKRYCYEFFGKFNPKALYSIEIIFKFNFNKISYNRFVREMNKFFLSIKQIGVSDTFELRNIETGTVIPEVILLKNISNEMMRDYFNCFCPDSDVNDNSKDIIYNNYFPKFETLLNKFIDKSDFDIVLKQIERRTYTRDTDIPDCIFIRLYYNIPRGKKYQRQDAVVDIKKKLFDYIPRILAVNFNICFLISSSKQFETDYTEFGEESKLKNLDKGVVDHIHNMASGARNYISTFYMFKTSDGSNSRFYMAFLNKKGKLLDGKIEFYKNMRWAYLFQPMQR